jgi:LysR family transcriptional regulator (chromosome initiation inhibitor)
MEIPLDLARTVAVAVDEGSLEAAARRLHITPSAVSQRIKSLEERLGRVLLVRSKPVRPTESGAAIVRLARQLILLEHDALAAVGAGDDTAHPTSIGIAVNADSLATWFLPALAEVAREHPVTFDLHREDEEYTTSLLESGQVMGAVTSRATAVSGCLVRPLRSTRYRAVAEPAFVARWFPGGATADALGLAPIINFDRRDDMQQAFLRSRRVSAAPPVHHVPASSEFSAAVRLGLGWGMLPDFQVGNALDTGELIELVPGSKTDVPLYWQQWNLRSELLDVVADAVAAAAGRR